MDYPKPNFDEIKVHIRSELKEFEQVGCSIAALENCINKYSERYGTYKTQSDVLEERVKTYQADNPKIIYHVRPRMKEYNSVADKLIKKCIEIKKKPGKKIKRPQELTEENNFFDPEDGLADFAGMRILHIKKGAWKEIHKYLEDEIVKNPETREKDFELTWKKAYVKSKDVEIYGTLDKGTKEERTYFKYSENKDESEIVIRESGYTSLHYVFRALDAPYNNLFFECQVRTVFDEGWGEISHEIDYPQAGHSIYKGHLAVLNATTSAANEVTAALEVLHELPTFIPWETEQRLERSAEQVHCLTPSLQWITTYLNDGVDNFSKCHGDVFYYVMAGNTEDEKQEIQKRCQTLIEELKKCSLLDIHVFVVPLPQQKTPYPVISDIVLLYKAVHPKESNPNSSAIIGGSPSGRKEEQLDMLIKDENSLKRLGMFFRDLNNTHFKKNKFPTDI